MKIAEIAPPWIAVPPPGYGGIEWVVALVADGLANRGNDVTLFASGGSKTTAKLHSTFDPAPGSSSIGDTYLEILHTFEAYEREDEFDVIHDHTFLGGLSLGSRSKTPVVHTVHGQLNEPTLRWYRMLGDRVHLVSISDSQRAPAPDLNWAGRVYNGIPLDRYPYREDKEDFLLFLGRVNKEKGPERAVEVAKRTGQRLVMAAAIKEPFEQEYWDTHVAPVLTGEEEIVGEISHDEKADLLARAKAVLFPIQWPEPFGLVMAEANACGTPVLVHPYGAAVEVIDDGVTGFHCADLDAMCEAVERIDEIDPKACRARVEENFSADAMAAGYAEVFERLTS